MLDLVGILCYTDFTSMGFFFFEKKTLRILEHTMWCKCFRNALYIVFRHCSWVLVMREAFPLSYKREKIIP